MGRSKEAEAVSAFFRALPRRTEDQVEAELDRIAREGPVQNPPPETLSARLADGVYHINENAVAGAVVFYLHGGGYMHDFAPFHWAFLQKLAERTDALILAPAYTRIPFGTCRDAFAQIVPLYTDCLAAHPGQKIVLMGDSSGGGMALALTEHFKGEGLPLPDELILLSPWVDAALDNPDIAEYAQKDPWLTLPWLRVCARHWAGDLDLRDWRVSPLYGDLSGLPPATVFVGTREIFYPDVIRFFDRLEGAENELIVGQEMDHDYPVFPTPEAAAALEKIAETILR